MIRALRQWLSEVRLSRELNVFAVIAFILSLFSLGWQSIAALRGAQLSVETTARVTMVKYLPQPDHEDAFALNAGLTFVNSGAPTYRVAIQNILADVVFPSNGDWWRREYVWLNFEEFFLLPDGIAAAQNTSSAHPIVVPGRDQQFQQVGFYGFPTRPETCGNPRALRWSALREGLQETNMLAVRFRVRSADGGETATPICVLRDIDLERLDSIRALTAYCNGPELLPAAARALFEEALACEDGAEVEAAASGVPARSGGEGTGSEDPGDAGRADPPRFRDEAADMGQADMGQDDMGQAGNGPATAMPEGAATPPAPDASGAPDGTTGSGE
ncbi:MAG: hypothetical protein AAFP13_10235 [Pseudomonadota bacterium]